MENPWPSGVPESLWTYNQLRAEELVQVPMMGIRFAPSFLYSFAFGCFFIAFFAWKRFSKQSEVKSVSRALSELSPSDMGGQGALLRAYFIYAGSILLLYVSLTFFGRLILQSAQMFPVAGIQVDLNTLQFDSMQWPLMLAFAFAGLADMLPPVKLTEGWLRNRAYHAVGIPIRLEQTTRNLIATLDWASTVKDPSKTNELVKRLDEYRDRWTKTIGSHVWVGEDGMQRESRQDEAVSLFAQLELLVYWAKAARGSWPGHEVSQAVYEKERDFVHEAETLLDDIHRRMRESPAAVSDDGNLAGKARFSRYLGEKITDAEKLRFDLVGILAIFLERDTDLPIDERVPEKKSEKITEPATPEKPEHIEPALNKLLVMTERPDSAGTGPEAGLFLALITVFLFYVAAAWRDIQLPIGQFMERTNVYGILITALVETLRIAALTWLPILAAFSLRQYLWDKGDWARATRTQRRSGYTMQIFSCLCLGATISIIALAGIATLRAFFIAIDRDYFYDLLFNGKAPFVIYYITQAVILLALIPISLLSADSRKSSAMRMWYGVLCAVCVGYLSIAHQNYWNYSVARDCPGLAVVASLDCAKRFDLVGHIILAIMAFLAAGVLGELPEYVRRVKPTWASHTASTGVVILLILQLAGVSPVFAQAPETVDASVISPTEEKAPRKVYIGFRADTPPFSQRRSPDDSTDSQPYEGYLANICFDIFAGFEKYEVVPVPIEAGNRFKLLRVGEAPSSETRLDFLCDAVTMRFSDHERSKNSIFSPVVFASGVSFLDRTRASGIMIIGYIENSTARDVSRKACEIDYFKGLLPSRRTGLYERCKLRWSAAQVFERLARLKRDNTEPSAATIIQIKKAWQDLLDASERMQPVLDANPERIDPDTKNLQLKLTGDKTHGNLAFDAWAECEKNNYAAGCDDILTLLRDPICDGKPVPPPAAPISIDRAPWPDYHFCPMDKHDRLIEWFCTTPVGQRRIYMGDRELILGKMRWWTENNGPCPVERPDGAEYLSYEPYAFPISLSDPALVQFIQRRVYELFSRREEMIGRFSASFPKRGMSPALAYLFLLNAVENDETLGPRPPTREELRLQGMAVAGENIEQWSAFPPPAPTLKQSP